MSTTDITDPPVLDGPTLLTGIVLYSTGDPEASALLMADGLIAWTGPERTAAILHDDARRLDLTGCLVTPGFVDAAATADGSAPDPAGEATARSRGVVLRLPGPVGEREGLRVLAPTAAGADPAVPYRDLVADGVPLALGSGGDPAADDPWDWVRRVAQEGDPAQRISDRAAFLAATRGGRRLAGERHPGDLRTGLAATFVVWEPWDLTVRGHGELMETWSTDPRSRTPLLPDLAQGSPRALLTVIDGRAVHADISGLDALAAASAAAPEGSA